MLNPTSENVGRASNTDGAVAAKLMYIFLLPAGKFSGYGVWKAPSCPTDGYIKGIQT